MNDIKTSQYNENARIFIEEAASPEKSQAAKEAKTKLEAEHRDLPEVLKLIALQSPMAMDQNPDHIAQVYYAAATSEIQATRKHKLTDLDKIHAANNGTKAAIVREAAAYVLYIRDPQKSTDSFIGLTETYRTDIADPGIMAVNALKTMGTDMHEFCRPLSDQQVGSIAAGQFDQVQYDPLINLLQVPGNEVYTKAMGPKITGNDYGPVVNAPQHHNRIQESHMRMASFGKKIAAVHQVHAMGTER